MHACTFTGVSVYICMCTPRRTPIPMSTSVPRNANVCLLLWFSVSLSICLPEHVHVCMYVCMYAFYYESIMHAVISLLRNRSTCAYVCIHMRTFYAELYMYTLIFTETHTPHVLTVYAVAAVRRFDTTEPSYYSPTVIYCRRQADVGEVQSWG